MGRFTLDPSVFSSALRAAREQRGITIRGLAQLAGIGQTTVFRLETGNYRVQFDILLRVLQVLDLSPTDVLTVNALPQDQPASPEERELLRVLREGDAASVMTTIGEYLSKRNPRRPGPGGSPRRGLD